MRNTCLSFVFFLVGLLGPTSALAAPGSAPQGASSSGAAGDAVQLPRYEETVVVTADRDAVDIRDVGSSVTVIDRQEIAASGARWLIDVLQFAPGVSVVRQGPPGAITEVFLRGANSSHTLFLLDGVKVNFPASGGYDLSNLALAADQIERIEIVRGPQSTLYGSQAIGGVINVITRRGEGAGTWGIEAEGGSYRTARVHTWANGQVDSLRYTGALSYLDSDGFSAADRNNGNPEADGFSNVAYNTRVDWAADNGARLRGFVRGFDGEAMFDGFSFTEGPVDALDNVQDRREIYAGGAAGYADDRFATEVEVSVSDVHSESLTPDDFFSGFFLDSTIREVDWQNDLELPAGQQLTAGVEYRREEASILSESGAGADGFDEGVDVTGVYLQDRFAIAGRAHLAAGFRYESHSTFGDKWTGRLTASIDAGEILRVYGSLGSAFKAPTLNDLYFPGFSNPDLAPEESVGLDIGVEAAGGRGRLGIAFFRNDITDLIQFDFVSGAPTNVGGVLTDGVELDGRVVLAPTVELAGNYTFTRAVPDGSDQQLIRRPRHQGGVRATWLPLTALRTWGELRFKAGRFDSGPAGRVSVDPYAIVNLAGDYRVSSMLLIRGRLDNLFDAEFEEVLGYGAVGISGYLGLTVTLSR